MQLEWEKNYILFNITGEATELENYTAGQITGNITPTCHDC